MSDALNGLIRQLEEKGRAAAASDAIGALRRWPYRAWLLTRLAVPSPLGWAISPGLRVLGLILGLPISSTLILR